MRTYYVRPSLTRDEFRKTHGGIKRSLEMHLELLPQFGWVESQDPKQADLVTGYLSTKTKRLDVFHIRGLYPTGEIKLHRQFFQGNVQIIENLRRARHVISVSDWVAEMLQRDLHIRPTVVPGHGLDLERWDNIEPWESNQPPYALWNKTRRYGVCDPQPVLELAKRFPNYRFVTTFLPRGETVPPNVEVTGLLPYEQAWRIVKGASVYLATTKETFGGGTLEAMASQCRIVGFHWGATPDVLGPIGTLVPPNDYNALAWAFAEAVDAGPDPGARERVQEHYRWEDVVAQTAAVYDAVFEGLVHKGPRVTVIIPVHNYAAYVETAIKSVIAQTYQDWELIVVDDGSTDDGAEKARALIIQEPRARLIQQENAGVAYARNNGIKLARGEFICCLDADDAIDPAFLDTVVPVLQEDRTLGIAYTGIRLMNSKNMVKNRIHAWPHQYVPEKGLRGNQIPTCCLFRREHWARLGGYRQRYALHGAGQEDADLWFRILASGGGAKMVEEGLFYYRTHRDQVTRRHRQDWEGDEKNKYLHWYPFVADTRHPLASQLGVPQFGSWPVRSYDCPLISVVVPVGPGHERILLDALDSVEAQTLREWELIVVNDSGTKLDLTPWPFAKLVETTGGKGAGFARNRGAELAQANLLVFLDADDFLQPEYLEKTYEAWLETGYWVYTDLYTQNSKGEIEPYHCGDWNTRLLWRSGLAAVTCLHSKAQWEKVGGFDENLLGREDWDFHLRLAKAGFCGIKVSEPLFTYRHSTGQRRVVGLRHAEAKTLRARYDLEELMRSCADCSGGLSGSRPRRRKKVTEKPVNWQSKADLGWPALEYVGRNTSDLTFRGRATRRIYRAGNNQFHKRIHVHPDDLGQLRALKCFRLVETTPERQLTAPNPRPIPTVEPHHLAPTDEGNGRLDVGALSVRALRAADLVGQDLEALIQDEREGKGRRTVVAFLRLEQRNRAAANRLGESA